MSRQTNTDGLDLAAIRARLAGARGQDYWRSLDELAETPEFTEFLHREFPKNASEWADEPSRRQFLRLMGASLALAGVSGCAYNPPDKIVPYVRQPETIVPGKAQYFATALSLGGAATGVLVESHMGRPTKVEGNELHPASRGATDAFSQAAVLSLYDPDRSRVVMREGSISTQDKFLADLADALKFQEASKGAGLRVLTETVGSPTLAHQLQKLHDRFPSSKWVQYEPAGRDSSRAGAKEAFGEDVSHRFHLDKADVILTLDAELLSCGPGHLHYARDFADRRRLPSATMNRLYAVETTPTTTGAIADHRIALRPSLVAPFARAVARGVGVEVGQEPSDTAIDVHKAWIAALVRDLKAHRGKCLVVVGDGQPAAVHALGHAINGALGNVGETIVYNEPIEQAPSDQMASLLQLTADMNAGKVQLLVILGGNPAYTAPADVGFAAALPKVQRAIHLSLYDDETSALCRWHVPAAHELEEWGDAVAFDGTASIVQPLISPLFGGMSAHQLVEAMRGRLNTSGLEIVRDYWKGRLGEKGFDTAWQTALHSGIVADTQAKAKSVKLKPIAKAAPATAAEGAGLEVVFRPDPTIWDGRFSNNGWLQELPKPLTKLTWDNAAMIAPATAERLKLASEDVVELRYRGRSVRAPIWIMPGHAADTVTVHFGYGRSRTGRVGEGAGFNAFALLTSDAPTIGTGLEVVKTGATLRLACTQDHRSLEGRDLVREGTLSEYTADPGFAHRGKEHGEPGPDDSLYPADHYEGYAWGMSINLNTCVGCNACVIACQAENNIPIVGKEEVLRGREMHWLDIDRYYKGNLDSPATVFQPRTCMHCEKAPCELVCPVAATTHSVEGLNEMTYNRCVGTRYCSNNCPYKVRHFNFFNYAARSMTGLEVLNNPDVTVRARGVMEKCTYCVQRINGARIVAKETGTTIGANEVVTACQAACPTRAIVFGDINNKDSDVVRLKDNPLNYAMLGELNTRPRTTYLARVRNPNREIEPESSDAHGTP